MGLYSEIDGLQIHSAIQQGLVRDGGNRATLVRASCLRERDAHTPNDRWIETEVY
ncbi:MAG TPA: hypothetical protein V6C57_18140 [Coleofasciculaceae cyanobacterium]